MKVAAIALGLLVELTSNLRHYGLEALAGQTTSALAAGVALAIAAVWLKRGGAPQAQMTPGAAAPPMERWLRYLPLTGACAGFWWMWARGAARLGAGWPVLAVVTLAVFLALALPRARPLWTVVAALALGTFFRGLLFNTVPLHANGGDMMPLVHEALGNLFSGKSPYATYSMPWKLPLTYLPLTFLAYAPAKLARVDLRWTNLVAELALAGALVYVSRRRRGVGQGWTDLAGSPAVFVWSWLFLLPTGINWDNIATASIAWAAIAWMMALVLTESRHSWIAAGATAAATPLAAVFLPLVLIAWWRDKGIRVTLWRTGAAALLASIIIAPWVLWSPQPFIDGVVLWFNDLRGYPRDIWTAKQEWSRVMGFSGIFWSRGWEYWLRPIQGASLALVVALFATRMKDSRLSDPSLAVHATAAFLLFMIWNPVLWPYFYHPALVCSLLAL